MMKTALIAALAVVLAVQSFYFSVIFFAVLGLLGIGWGGIFFANFLQALDLQPAGVGAYSALGATYAGKINMQKFGRYKGLF